MLNFVHTGANETSNEFKHFGSLQPYTFFSEWTITEEGSLKLPKHLNLTEVSLASVDKVKHERST